MFRNLRVMYKLLLFYRDVIVLTFHRNNKRSILFLDESRDIFKGFKIVKYGHDYLIVSPKQHLI